MKDEERFKRICIKRLKLFRVPYLLRSYPRRRLLNMISLMDDQGTDTMRLVNFYVSYRQVREELIRRTDWNLDRNKPYPYFWS
jgi:hypothetical protein